MAAKKKIEETVENVVKTAEKAAEKVAEKTEKAVAKAKENPTVKKAAKNTAETAKKATATVKKAASAAKKATEKVSAYVEFGDKQVSVDEIADKVRAAYKAEGHRGIKSIEIYVKPEENAAYYVVNGKAEGKKIDL